MKWEKRGRLFEPQRHPLPAGCSDFAQAPQALVFDDFVRIYFSTRERQDSRNWLSHVSFADFDLGLTQVLRTAVLPVLPLGELGSFDEHGIFPFHVVRQDDTIYAFTCGWSRRVSVPVETAIGLALSDDKGVTFRRFGSGPIMTATHLEPFLVGDPFVLRAREHWHMWYIFGTAWLADADAAGAPARIYKIAHATSVDAIHWQRDSRPIMADVLGPTECQALPTVIELDGRFHMYFCYRHATDFRTNPARSYRLGYAHSEDLSDWTRNDAQGGIEPGDSGWDSEMLCYPHVFRCNREVYMLYNGNEFGRNGFGLAILGDR